MGQTLVSRLRGKQKIILIRAASDTPCPDGAASIRTRINVRSQPLRTVVAPSGIVSAEETVFVKGFKPMVLPLPGSGIAPLPVEASDDHVTGR